ncbi:DUF6916 family protein [Luethyella okanaganae]|uniref:DUF6916 family protein n=1 Tax=Luethyella okanaganae TaxID=69372 RepID=A0ABW1VDH2_9MICO
MLEISRRSVVSAAVGSAGAAALSAAAQPLAANANARATPTGGLPVRSHFVPHIGRSFTADSGSTRTRLRLSEIDDVLPLLEEDDENRFNLIFESEGLDISSGIYEVSRPGVPTAVLFLSEVGSDTAGVTLQALVNRLS